MSAAQEIVANIAPSGFIPGTNYFHGEFKEFYPDATTVVRDSGGSSPEPALGEGPIPGKLVRVQFPSIQVICRGARDDYDGPMATAEALYAAFVGICNQQLGTAFYLEIEPLQEPFLLRTDVNFRSYIAFNARIMKGPS